jgi:DNA replication and repair protein RecF
MSLERLKVQNVRNISEVELSFDSRLNLISGQNGSGKTSLLESILFLEKGRPHKSLRLAPLVRNGSEFCTVFGLAKNHQRSVRLGIRRDLNGKREIRINGEVEKQASVLAEELPVLYLGPETVDLLLGSPSLRRSFLNWGVFHVEPQFKKLWVDANRSLKQRNQLLRQSMTQTEELVTWTTQLAVQAEVINRYRLSYFRSYEKLFYDILGLVSKIDGVSLSYDSGWQNGMSLLELYENRIESDLRRGFTQYGFQRADFKISINGELANLVCSRGELKSIAWALVLAQGKLLADEQRNRAIFLVDDIASELDKDHRERFCKWLWLSESQIFATGIESESLRASWQDMKGKEFHVKHGVFTNQEKKE